MGRNTKRNHKKKSRARGNDPRRNSIKEQMSSSRESGDTHQKQGLIADRDYKAGEVIIRTKPFAHAINSKGLFCDNCLRPPSNGNELLKCGNCRKFYYCNKKCQLEDWENGHKHKECLFYKAADPEWMSRYMDREMEPKSDHIRIEIRALLKILAHPDIANMKVDTLDGQSLTFMDLKSNMESMDQACNFLRPNGPIKSNDSRAINNYLEQKTGQHDWWNAAITRQVFWKAYSNCFLRLFCYDIGGHAWFLDLAFSRLNHSCRPNAKPQLESGPFCVLRAQRDIEKGEELNISYLDHAVLSNGKHVRQRQLLSRQKFLCKCERCLAPMSQDELMLQYLRFENSILRMTIYGVNNGGPFAMLSIKRRLLFIDIGLRVKINKLLQKIFGNYCEASTAQMAIILWLSEKVDLPDSSVIDRDPTMTIGRLRELFEQNVRLDFGPNCPLLDQNSKEFDIFIKSNLEEIQI